MRWKINRTWRVMLIVLVVLIGVRLALPFIVTRYVNNVLGNLNGYRGVFDKIDVQLSTGGYEIQGLRIYKADGNKEIPFIEVANTKLSVDWDAVLQGAFLGEVNLDHPTISFLGSSKSDSTKIRSDSTSQSSDHIVDWTSILQRLLPMDINRLSVDNGKVAFYDFNSQPHVEIFLYNIQLDALNLSNAKDNPEDLPSRIYLQALSIGNGQLNLAMKVNVQREVPDIDMDLRFENVNMQALNSFFEAYAHVDVMEGNFNLYSELSVNDGTITGYVKPLFRNLKVSDSKITQQQTAHAAWGSLVAFFDDIIRDKKRDQFATRFPLEGEIAEDDTIFWPQVWDVFSSGLTDAFGDTSKPTVSIAAAPSVNRELEIAEKSKKELRKEKRREKKKAKKERKAKTENEKADKKQDKDNS